MMTVHEVSELTGLSARALHHYDAIGLLRPAAVTPAGYRLYDDASLARLQAILLFRELGFPLKKIAEVIDRPDFDRDAAIEQQITLLELQRRRLSNLIGLARRIKQTGDYNMDFTAFDDAELREQQEKAKKLWGSTDAYKEYEKKAEHRSAADKKELGKAMMAIFAELGAVKRLASDSEQAQALVAKLRAFISDNYYNCTTAIFRSLGQMYAAGGDFTDNIDAAGGEGTADFACRAITVYCDRAEK